MSDKPAGGRCPEEVLDLLKNLEFCADAQSTIAEAAEITIQPFSVEERQSRLERLGQEFEKRWGVTPPTTSELLDSDPRRRFVDAIASGRWGLVAVFPGTTNRQIRGDLKKIRSVIRKQHQDALITRHAQLVRWLQILGFDRPTIARAIFQRRTGLHRPTKAQAIARTPERREQQLVEQYRGLGLTKKEIDRKIYRRLRGSEAQASAAIRMTEQRYVTRLERLNQNLASPVQAEPLSHALTILFRALPDENSATVRHHATAVRDAFVGVAVPPRTTVEQLSAHSPLEAIVSGRWGVVLVFPWTSDLEIRAPVKKLRTMMRQQPQDGSEPTPVARPNQFEPMSDALISLFRAVTDREDIVVRRHAFEARATFVQAGAS